MRFGLHLPQFGRVATAQALTAAAQGAESLGYDDVWVSDHQVSPHGQPYPPARLIDPLTALTWVAAGTERIGIGTSVLIVPQYSTVALANSIASLDVLSGGRCILGCGIGWLEREFQALGYEYGTRGKRMDEALEVFRACWSQDPINFSGRWHEIDNMRMQPQPEREIPIWVGGSSEPAYARGVAHGNGFHAGAGTIEEMEALVARLRRDRPEDEFTISVRTEWDALTTDAAEISDTLQAWSALGIQHVVATPVQRTVDDWLRSAERFAELCTPHR